ncbi:MAG TPA: ABC transporter permease [Acidobacteriaceae bacterium]|jgi:ABC-2 type transport system permease protein|nr:ABC transporter permease [Acidobacteriaceae bacterium]
MATQSIALAPQKLGAGYYARVFRKETQYEFVRMLRTRAFSFSVVGFPVMFFLLFGVTNRASGYGQYLVPAYSCMGVGFACLFGIGVSVGLDRTQGWLEVKQASPMPRFLYLAAKVMGCATFALIIVGLLVLLGVTLGGVTVTALQVLELCGVIVAASIPFTAMALLVALLVPPNSGPGLINLIYMPMSFASGFFMPIQYLPHWLRSVAPALPTYHLAQLALNIFGFAGQGSMLVHWEALAGFTLLMLGAVWILFRRSEAKA